MNASPETIIQAYVTLSPAESGPHRSTVASTLETLGFAVTRTSPLSIGIRGSKALYELTFQASIREQPAVENGDNDHTAGGSSWEWEAPPLIPEALKPLAREIVLPRPVRLHPD